MELATIRLTFVHPVMGTCESKRAGSIAAAFSNGILAQSIVISFHGRSRLAAASAAASRVLFVGK